MPIRTKETEKRLPRLYWKIQKGTGMFTTSFVDENGKNHTLTVNEIEGTLGSVFLIDDPGNPKADIKAHTKVALTIFDDEAIHQVAVKSSTNFAGSLASRIGQVARGQKIRLNVRKGTKKASVSFANIQVQTSAGDWAECSYVTMPEDEKEKEAMTLKIFEEHPAKSPRKSDSDSE